MIELHAMRGRRITKRCGPLAAMLCESKGMLQDRAKTYNEKFSVTFTKLDGNKITIAN